MQNINITLKDLIISLIKDDLIHNKLIHGLSNIGLETLYYHQHLSETIFMLMGFGEDKKSEEAFEFYIMQTRQANYINIKTAPEILDAIAADIYFKLERRRANVG